MSHPFSDTDARNGLVQMYEREIGVDLGFVSGNTNRLKDFTADTRVAFDEFFSLAIQVSGTWQMDDSNHSKFPIIYATLTSGQQDYTFTTDEQGNLLLDIYKVAILPSATATKYQAISPIDEQSGESTYLLSEDTDTGVPFRYDKTANGIMLEQTPGYTVAKGLKVYINREASYFVSTDTTKMPGVPGLFHSFFYIKPAHDYARRNGEQNLPQLQQEYLRLKEEIGDYFSERTKDENPRLSVTNHNNK